MSHPSTNIYLYIKKKIRAHSLTSEVLLTIRLTCPSYFLSFTFFPEWYKTLSFVYVKRCIFYFKENVYCDLQAFKVHRLQPPVPDFFSFMFQLFDSWISIILKNIISCLTTDNTCCFKHYIYINKSCVSLREIKIERDVLPSYIKICLH